MSLQSGQLHFIPLYYSSLIVPKYQFRLPLHWQSFLSVSHKHRPTLHAKAVMENIKYDQSPEYSLRKLYFNPICSPFIAIFPITLFIHLQLCYSSSSLLACQLMSHAALNPVLWCSLGRLVLLHFSGLKKIRLNGDPTVTLTSGKPELPFCIIFPFISTFFNCSFLRICHNGLHTFKVRVTPHCLLPFRSLPIFFWTPCVSVAACLALKHSLPLEVHECIFCAKICLFSERKSARCPKAQSY